MEPKTAIDASAFRERLAELCVRPRTKLPRKQRDRHILLRSVLLLLDPEGLYGEAEVNAAIRDWLRSVAGDLRVDHVAIRRALIDAGYLTRTSDGSAYLAGRSGLGVPSHFAPEVDTLRPVEIVAERRRRIAQDRAAYLERARTD